MDKTITQIYLKLLNEYGPQGWWPVYSLRNTKYRDNRGYLINPGLINTYSDLGMPDQEGVLHPNSHTIFEIALGSILTQNTAWTNVEKVLVNMIEKNLVDPYKIIDLNQNDLAVLILSSGYYNQKAKKIKVLTQFLLQGNYLEPENVPKRNDLLALWGIGDETADSILLYAYNFPVFVVDTYTKRIFSRLGLLAGNETYGEIAAIFTYGQKKDPSVYQEYHALIVKHAKEHCMKKPVCDDCVLNTLCRKNR